MTDLQNEIPEVHPLYRDPMHGWTCLRHGGCGPALILRDAEAGRVIYQPVTYYPGAQHTYSPLCDGIHDPGPCP